MIAPFEVIAVFGNPGRPPRDSDSGHRSRPAAVRSSFRFQEIWLQPSGLYLEEGADMTIPSSCSIHVILSVFHILGHLADDQANTITALRTTINVSYSS